MDTLPQASPPQAKSPCQRLLLGNSAQSFLPRCLQQAQLKRRLPFFALLVTFSPFGCNWRGLQPPTETKMLPSSSHPCPAALQQGLRGFFWGSPSFCITVTILFPGSKLSAKFTSVERDQVRAALARALCKPCCHCTMLFSCAGAVCGKTVLEPRVMPLQGQKRN